MSIVLKETHYVIAVGGYLNDEIKIDKHEFSDEDEAFKDEYDDFGEYVDDEIENAIAEYSQGFSSAIAITADQLPQLIEKLKTEQNAK
jgi:hypothetical protein